MCLKTHGPKIQQDFPPKKWEKILEDLGGALWVDLHTGSVKKKNIEITKSSLRN